MSSVAKNQNGILLNSKVTESSRTGKGRV